MLALPAFAAAKVVSGVAAIVNGDIITIHELDHEYAQAAKEAETRGGALSADAARTLRSGVLNAMIDRKLVRDKIRELNIVISEEEVRQSIEEIKKQNRFSQPALVAALLAQGITFDQYKARMKEQLEHLRLISQEVKSKISVAEPEIAAYYNGNPAEFSENGGFRASSIFFSLPADASAAEKRATIAKIVTVMQAISSKADFTELAKQYSDDPNAKNDGGDLGHFKKGEMLAAIEEKVVSMKAGEVSELIRTPAGFHIIKLEEKRPPRIKPLAAVKAQIEELLYKKKSDERFSRWTEELRKGATIEVLP
jgi:peptidyl-prolyl cis-trans isomerase SurA